MPGITAAGGPPLKSGKKGPTFAEKGDHFRYMRLYDVQLGMLNVMDHIKTEVEYNVMACGCKKDGVKIMTCVGYGGLIGTWNF